LPKPSQELTQVILNRLSVELREPPFAIVGTLADRTTVKIVIGSFVTYAQIANTGNEDYRDSWVAEVLQRYRPESESPTLIDVGAGASPYREIAVNLGYKYRSHDFSEYFPSDVQPGLQNNSWPYPEHTFVCDITEIPDLARSDLVLCTEVLEHVPDPVRAFERMVELLNPDGRVVVTVPFMSLMHQAPYWFQSGLSPFWFEHWADKNHLEIEVLAVYGDYADLMAQELARLLEFRPHIRGLGRVGAALARRTRKRLPRSVLESGGFGTVFIGRRPF
jgi:SAM-dependent methyltransferase